MPGLWSPGRKPGECRFPRARRWEGHTGCTSSSSGRAQTASLTKGQPVLGPHHILRHLPSRTWTGNMRPHPSPSQTTLCVQRERDHIVMTDECSPWCSLEPRGREQGEFPQCVLSTWTKRCYPPSVRHPASRVWGCLWGRRGSREESNTWDSVPLAKGSAGGLGRPSLSPLLLFASTGVFPLPRWKTEAVEVETMT